MANFGSPSNVLSFVRSEVPSVFIDPGADARHARRGAMNMSFRGESGPHDLTAPRPLVTDCVAKVVLHW